MRTMTCSRCWGRKTQPNRIPAVVCGRCNGTGREQDAQLSPHFWLSEFLRSEIAARKGISNEVSAEQIAKLRDLAALLEQVRGVVGVPLEITSGYRSIPLNRAVGSDDGSAHPHCLAADVNAKDMDELETVRRIAASGLALDQALCEGPWTHIGLRRPSTGEQRRMIGTFLPSGSGPRKFVRLAP